MQFPISKFGLTFRLVEETDAPFILSLRTDPKLSQYLSPIENGLKSQVNWIKNYKQREARGEEYYILFENEAQQPSGVVRVYKITQNTCTNGSWLIRPSCDESVAVKSDLFVLIFTFAELKVEKCFVDTRKENKKVMRYHKRFMEQIGEDEESVYFMMGKDGYQRKYQFLTGILQ